MNIFVVAFVALVSLVTLLAIYSIVVSRRLSKALATIAEINLKPRTESIELQEFLGDILSSGGIVRVERIAPIDVLVRSTRGM